MRQDNIMFIQNAVLLGFVFSCISASLPKTEANWNDVMSDLKAIKSLIQVSAYVSTKSLVSLLRRVTFPVAVSLNAISLETIILL